MGKYQFGIFNFTDKNVKVESTKHIKGAAQFKQITSCPDLENEDGWIEFNFPNRKEPNKKVAAKVLLFGGLYNISY